MSMTFLIMLLCVRDYVRSWTFHVVILLVCVFISLSPKPDLKRLSLLLIEGIRLSPMYLPFLSLILPFYSATVLDYSRKCLD
jgi:hypothetical protein